MGKEPIMHSLTSFAADYEFIIFHFGEERFLQCFTEKHIIHKECNKIVQFSMQKSIEKLQFYRKMFRIN